MNTLTVTPTANPKFFESSTFTPTKNSVTFQIVFPLFKEGGAKLQRSLDGTHWSTEESVSTLWWADKNKSIITTFSGFVPGEIFKFEFRGEPEFCAWIEG